jgi:hypothetical protein
MDFKSYSLSDACQNISPGQNMLRRDLTDCVVRAQELEAVVPGMKQLQETKTKDFT